MKSTRPGHAKILEAAFALPSLDPGKLLTGWLTLKSILFLPAAAISSHSLVVDLRRRRDVVIVVFGFPDGGTCDVSLYLGFPLMGLPPRLLGALESDSRGQADSAFR